MNEIGANLAQPDSNLDRLCDNSNGVVLQYILQLMLHYLLNCPQTLRVMLLIRYL